MLADEPARRRLAEHPLVDRQRRAGVEPFVQGPDGLFRLAHTDQHQACVFLEGNDCSLHAHSGEQVKPRACRQFPFFFKVTPDGVFVGLSFRCTAVLAAHGRPLEAHRQQLQELLDSGDYPRAGFEPMVLFGQQTIEWPAYQQLEQRLGHSLTDQGARAEVAWAALCELTGRASPDPYRQQWLAAAIVGWLEQCEPAAVLSGTMRSPRFAQGARAASFADPELEARLSRFLGHLLFRKYLVGPELLGRTVVWIVLPAVARFYAANRAAALGQSVTGEHLDWCLSLLEGELLAHVEDTARLYQTLGEFYWQPEVSP
ncbi:MAG: hypothetical protein KC910_12180 [Candidatus Eremiobacteraeota bacterium]|nr:hypothetical protein [Candidatus Eremiobacteraeota bacterium]